MFLSNIYNHQIYKSLRYTYSSIISITCTYQLRVFINYI